MKWKKLFSSSVGKKITMALTGIFLIVFLIVHCYVNANVFFSGAEENFNKAAHFMSTNILVRIMEIGLFAGFILHIVQGYMLEASNRARRSTKYAVTAGNKTSKWYSRSMALLGTLILLFLVVHLSDFWVPSRFGHLDPVVYDGKDYHNLYLKMDQAFDRGWAVIVYLLGCFSLAWHLLHGFQSAFQTMGWNHSKYTSMIRSIGIGYAVLVPLIFALMPLFFYFDIEPINIGSITLLF
jgi:succinate dehydrogenase / fumarate reductase cytochrome b subunit